MTLSPEQKDKLLRTAAGMLVEQLREDLGGSFQSIHIVPLLVAEKLTSLSRNTLRAVLPVVEISPGKHGVRMCELREYLDRKTTRPTVGREKKEPKP